MGKAIYEVAKTAWKAMLPQKYKKRAIYSVLLA